MNGAAYTDRVDAHDDNCRPLTQTVTIPLSATGLNGSHTCETRYNPDGSVGQTSLPATADLPTETLSTHCNPVSGLPKQLSARLAFGGCSLVVGLGLLVTVGVGGSPSWSRPPWRGPSVVAGAVHRGTLRPSWRPLVHCGGCCVVVCGDWVRLPGVGGAPRRVPATSARSLAGVLTPVSLRTTVTMTMTVVVLRCVS